MFKLKFQIYIVISVTSNFYFMDMCLYQFLVVVSSLLIGMKFSSKILNSTRNSCMHPTIFIFKLNVYPNSVYFRPLVIDPEVPRYLKLQE